MPKPGSKRYCGRSTCQGGSAPIKPVAPAVTWDPEAEARRKLAALEAAGCDVSNLSAAAVAAAAKAPEAMPSLPDAAATPCRAAAARAIPKAVRRKAALAAARAMGRKIHGRMARH